MKLCCCCGPRLPSCRGLLGLAKRAIGGAVYFGCGCWLPWCGKCRNAFGWTGAIAVSEESDKLFGELGFGKADIVLLHNVFLKADEDRSGELTVYEFLEYLNVEHSKFADRMFALIDKDASGLIDFEEFVVATWNYCTMTKAALIKFAFELYDVDGSGSINQLELKDMFLEVCGEDFAQSERAQLLLEKVEGIAAAHHINDGEITVGVFADFIKQNAGLLTSVFHLQLQMQKQLGGLSFWKHMSTVREELVEAGKGDVSSMGDIMKLHNEREKGERKVKKMAKDSESRQATRRALLKKQQSFAKGAGNRIAVTSNANGQNPYMKRHRDRKLDAIDLLDSVAATIEDNEIVVPHEHYLKDVVLNNPARDLSLDAEMEKYLADQARTRGWQEEWDSTSTMKTTNAAGEELVKYKD